MQRRSLLFAALAASSGVSVAHEAAEHVQTALGTLPLILTVPHDGGDFLGFAPVRTKGVTGRDAGTRQLAERVAALLEQRLGKRPSLVVARISRKYLDVNRSEQDAMESPDGLPAYREYHAQITACVSAIQAVFPAGGLLVDVHGQSDDPNTTFRGTRSGLTAKHLVSRFGPAALQGDKSITGVLASKGYQVFPLVGAESLREDPRFSGGYTVATYGSHMPGGIDAIQLEFGKNHRASASLAADVADALASFLVDFEILPK
jgi:N-formylglutamate amidohydrolase